MSAARRTVSRLAASGVAAALLVGGVAAQAEAAGYPHVTLAKAKAALPPSTSLPGNVKREGSVTTAPRSYAVICTTKAKKVVLTGGSIAIADYKSAAPPNSDAYQEYEISVVAFETTAQAQAAVAKLNAVEKACPKTGQVDEGGVPVAVTRTLSTKASSKAWTGRRSLDHLVASGGSVDVALRGYETYLARGNVLTVIDQIGPGSPATGKAQDNRRKAVTNLVIKRLSAIK
jgi:hypothetical protein